MSETLLTVFGLLVAVLSLVAAFVAPRVLSSKRLAHEVFYVSRLDTLELSSKVQVKIFHDGQQIDNPAFVTALVLRNIGARDITRDDFINPIVMKVSEFGAILSAEADGKEGVEPLCIVSNGCAELSWTILKPGEKIFCELIIESLQENISHDDLVDRLAVIARLKDVEIGLGIRRFLRPAVIGVASFFAGFAGFATAAVTTGLVPRHEWTYVDKDQRQIAIVTNGGILDSVANRGFRLCSVKDGVRERRSECQKVSAAEAAKLIPTASLSKVRVALSVRDFVIGIAPAVILSLLATALYIFLDGKLVKLLRRHMR